MKQVVREGFEIFGFSFGTLAAVIVAVIVFSVLVFGLYGFFQPRYVEVQYQTFKQSQSYNEGMVQQLAAYRVQYHAAISQGEKDAIRSTVLEQFASYNESNLPTDLSKFLNQMKEL
jgi:hypothetical protein